MASRGIMDQATQAKLEQDQRAAQAAQFDKTFAEGQRRFDTTMAREAENTAWARSQEEKKTAEEQRRFGLAQQAAERGEQRVERQLSLDEFRAQLAQRREERVDAREDISTQMASAQLQQYLAATDEEKQAKANRDRIAKGAFGSLVIAGRLNGGVMPTKALEIANQELGDKNTQITGGGFDEETGIAFFNMTNLQTGETRQLKMTPENQYSVIHAGIGKREADMFYETFKTGSSVRAAVERRRMELQDAADVETRKYAARQELAANNPLKKAELLQKQADNYMKLAEKGTDSALIEEYQNKATMYQKEADKLLMGEKGADGAEKPFTVTPEMQSKYGVPPVGFITTKKPDGGYKVTWKDKGNYYSQDFAPGTW